MTKQEATINNCCSDFPPLEKEISRDFAKVENTPTWDFYTLEAEIYADSPKKRSENKPTWDFYALEAEIYADSPKKKSENTPIWDFYALEAEIYADSPKKRSEIIL